MNPTERLRFELGWDVRWWLLAATLVLAGFGGVTGAQVRGAACTVVRAAGVACDVVDATEAACDASEEE